MRSSPHIPVLLDEVLEALALQDGDVCVDGTFGAGGYSRALLKQADCTVFAIDRDPAAIAAGRALSLGRLTLLEGCFGDMAALLLEHGVHQVNAIVLDIGVSSMQLDQAERGFSFAKDGPLDMRMGQSGLSAADVVNTYDEGTLADIFFQLGEERQSRRVARAIVAARTEKLFERTAELSTVIRSAIRGGHDGSHALDPATRTFQALRIHVNDELGELRRGLAAAEHLLAPGGRLAVVSFHSLEDRLVKSFLREGSGGTPEPSRHLPQATRQDHPPAFVVSRRKAIKPSESEMDRNPRSRSARLRCALRSDTPARPGAGGEA